MAIATDNSSLLLYRVGPVLCCAPTLPVNSIIPPPTLTRPPGTNASKPGIFRHAGHITSSIDLRYKFGVDEEHWSDPCKVIVTEIDPGLVGFWVDEIMDVMDFPASGWGPLPSHLPRGIFSRTLILDQKIYLYAEFSQLYKIPNSGYLRVYIEKLLEEQQRQQKRTASASSSGSSISTRQSVTKQQRTSFTKPAMSNVKPEVTVTSTITHSGSRNAIKPAAASNKDSTASSAITSNVHHLNLDNVDTENENVKTKVTASNPETTSAKPIDKNLKPAVSSLSVQQKPTTSLNKVRQAQSVIIQKKPASFTPETNNLEKANDHKPVPQTNTNNTPDINTTNLQKQQASNPFTESETSSLIPGLIFIFIFIGIIAGLFWYLARDIDKPIVNRTNQERSVSQLSDASVTEQSALPKTEKDRASSIPGKNLHNKVPDESSKISQQLVHEPESIEANDVENIKVEITEPESSKLAATIDENIQTETSVSISESTQPESSTPSTFKAEIQRDDQGITIVLDAPEDENVFKQEETPAQITGSTLDTSKDQVITENDEIQSEFATISDELVTQNQTATSPEISEAKSRLITTEIIHIVVKGDTLWHIAIKYVNDPYKYPELAKLSNIKNPDLIYPGNRVRIIKRTKTRR